MLRVKFITILSCAFSIILNCEAQLIPNLVMNPSFEEHYKCPHANLLWRGNIHYSKHWFNPRMMNPDYYNSCAIPSITCPTCFYFGVPNAWSYQYPRTGNAMVGIFLVAIIKGIPYSYHAREYITGTLKQRLQTDSTYCFEIYVNCDNKSRIRAHSLGAYFSTYISPIDTLDFNQYYDTIGVTPQIKNTSVLFDDTLGWKKFAQEFVATDTFKFVTIGNFEPNATTWITAFDTSKWESMSYLYLDDVSVYKGKCREEEKPPKTFFNLYPNPGSGVFSLNYGVAQDAQLVVYDILGRTVLNETLAADKVLHHFIMQQYSNGMYFLKVFGANDDELYSQKFLLQR